MDNKEMQVRKWYFHSLKKYAGMMPSELTGDINLLDEDLIDSLDYTELLVGIEEALSVTMAPSEF